MILTTISPVTAAVSQRRQRFPARPRPHMRFLSLCLAATLLSTAAAAAAACKITGQQWTMNNTGGKTGLGEELLVARDLSQDGSGSSFNITGVNLHGYGGKSSAMTSDPWHGTVRGKTIKLTITKGSFFKGADFADQQCTGTFGDDCATIDWGPKGCLESPVKREGSPASWRCSGAAPGQRAAHRQCRREYIYLTKRRLFGPHLDLKGCSTIQPGMFALRGC